MNKVLTIAGSDPSAGAGLQADLKTFAALRVYGLSVVTALTAQNTEGVSGVHLVPAEFVARQMDAVLEDIKADAVKTGMLASVDIIEVVSERLRRHEVRDLVVDPVMVATSGDLLTAGHVGPLLDAFRNVLLPLARVVTPNIPEAEILTGREIYNLGDMKAAASDLYKLGVPNVVVKGGHLDDGNEAIDLLYDGTEFVEFRVARIDTVNTHGTGCTFASALAASLAKGYNVREAVGEAKAFVWKALKASFGIGRGRGPTHHFAELYRLADCCPKEDG